MKQKFGILVIGGLIIVRHIKVRQRHLTVFCYVILCAFSKVLMRKTIVYVDGFNLYYALKKENTKWLDIGALCERLLTDNDIIAIKYFTARVKSRVGDLDIHVRKNIYLEALRIRNGVVNERSSLKLNLFIKRI